VVGDPPPDGLARVAGVLHVHTTLSDGGGSPQEVIAAAREAGLGFVGITDHNNLDAKPLEGYHGGVLVLVGSELSTTAGHLLALGIPDPVFRFSGDAQDGLEDVRDLGGIAFAAHPLSPRDDLRWTGWDLPGPWGLELINGDSEWRTTGRLQMLSTAALYCINQRYALLGSLNPPEETLARWDRLLAQRDVAGIVGTDAHSRLPLTKTWSLRFPSYQSLFSLLQNHVLLDSPLTGEVGPDTAAIVNALRHGRSYVGLDGLAPAGGFFFTVEGGGRRWTMGGAVPAGPGLTLRAGGRLPRGSQVVVLRDGRPLAAAVGGAEIAISGPGVYRVEVKVPRWRVPWILSNPIYVFAERAQEERAQRAAWAPEPTVPPLAAVLDRFQGTTTFRPEFDPSSWVDPEVLDPGGGPSGKPAARLAFRLGAPGPGRPHTWCALVDRQNRDLSGRTGLAVSIRGDGVYRVWVQVRDENPASPDEGAESWFASVRTSTRWRRVSLPFSRFRSLNPRSDGRLDLDKVRQIVFVLDGAAVKVGTAGTIWLADLGVY
jgi:hypothetical protein